MGALSSTPEKDYASIPDVWSETRTEVIKCNYQWSISNFSLIRKKNGEYLLSSQFGCQQDKDFKWQLKLYPKGWTDEDKAFLSLGLVAWPRVAKPFLATFTFNVIGKDFEVIHSRHFENEFVDSLFNLASTGPYVPHSRDGRPVNVRSSGISHTCSRFLRNSAIFDQSKGILVNDTLTITCDLSVVKESTINLYQRSDAIIVPQSNLSTCFGHLLQKENLSDVKFLVDGRTFNAHKAVLSCRSPVFAAMFSTGFVENETKEIIISDIRADVFSELLRFVYTDSVMKLESMAKELLIAAHKYDLSRLKALCEVALHCRLNVENAAEILVLADMYSGPQLRRVAIEYIKGNIDGVVNTERWACLLASQPRLLRECFTGDKLKK